MAKSSTPATKQTKTAPARSIEVKQARHDEDDPGHG
jgi:hypothetical protein